MVRLGDGNRRDKMIEGVAIKYKGTLYDLPRPNRHCHVIAMIVEKA